MRIKLITLLFTISTILFNGCVCINCDEKINDTKDPTIEEINAVRKMSFESNKANAYERIAARIDLSEAAQVHLVKAAFDNLEFDSSKEKVLWTLIQNPSFSEEAEIAILKRVNRFSFESTKDNILRAINAIKTLQGTQQSNKIDEEI